MKDKAIIKNVMKVDCMSCSAADVKRDIDTTRLVLDPSADLKHNTRRETKCPTHTHTSRIYRPVGNSSAFFYVICICLRIVVFNAYCVVGLFCFASSCVLCVSGFSGFVIFDCPFGVL